MFFSLFSSKNQKLVKQWHKEHEQIVVLATKVIEEYSKNNHKASKKELVKLNKLTMKHLMEEDIELFRLLKDQGRLDGDTEKFVLEFKESFQGTKSVLMGFLTKYTRSSATLDEEFFIVFNELVGVLGERIAFEEKNLYSKLEAN